MSFRLKTIIGIALIELSVMAILITVNQFNLGGTASSQLYDRVRGTGNLFATMVADAVIATDLATLDAMIENALENEELIYIRVRNTSGVVLAQNGATDVLTAAFVPDADFGSAMADHRIDLSAPISIADRNFGSVEIGVSTLRVEAEIASALHWNVIVAVIGMSLVAIFGYGLGSVLTSQLSSLQEGARRITQGQLGYQIKVRGRDELADTAMCFNTMATTLASDRHELERRQQELLEKRDRTHCIVESMKLIADGSGDVSVPDSEREDEIGDMARATIVFRDTMHEVQKAREEQARLVHAFDQLDEQVAIYGEDGGVIFINAAFRRFNAEVIKDLPTSFTRTEFLETGLRHGAYPAAIGREQEWLQSRMDWSDGSKPPSEVKRAPDRTLLVRATDVKGIGTVISSSDITELKVSQAQLVQASKLATLGEMATGVAHELNQPLGVIRMASNNCIKRIQKGSLDAEYLIGKLERMSDQTERAAQIIDHMRIFGRKADGSQETFEVFDAILNACNLMTAQLRNDSVSIVQTGEKSEALVSGKQVMFEQVILNLFSNARDAINSRDDKEAIAGKIYVSAERKNDDWVSICVEDTGGGIPEELLDRLFDPFFTTKEPGKGTGLGLSISYGIIKEMDGRISVDKGENGARFTIDLPIETDGRLSTAA